MQKLIMLLVVMFITCSQCGAQQAVATDSTGKKQDASRQSDENRVFTKPATAPTISEEVWNKFLVKHINYVSRFLTGHQRGYTL